MLSLRSLRLRLLDPWQAWFFSTCENQRGDHARNGRTKACPCNKKQGAGFWNDDSTFRSKRAEDHLFSAVSIHRIVLRDCGNRADEITLWLGHSKPCSAG